MPTRPITALIAPETVSTAKRWDLGDVAIQPRQRSPSAGAHRGRRQLFEMAEDREPQREQHVCRQPDMLVPVDAADQR